MRGEKSMERKERGERRNKKWGKTLREGGFMVI